MLKSGVLIVVLVLVRAVSFAHPISLTTAQVEVSAEQVRVALTVMYEDFTLYQAAQANEQGFLGQQVLQQAIKGHGAFLLECLHLHEQSGRRLSGKLIQTKAMRVGPHGLRVSELMAKTVTYYLVYPVKRVRLLTFYQLFPGGSSLPALMEVTVSQGGRGMLRPARLTNGGNRYSVGFSWRKKAGELSPRVLLLHSPSAELFREEKTLRFSLSIPLELLEARLELKRKEQEFIACGEREAMFSPIAILLRRGVRVELNRQLASPISARLELEGEAGNALTLLARLELVFVAREKIGDFSLKIAGIFDQDIYEIPCKVEGLAPTQKVFFTAYKPEFSFSSG